MFRVSLPTIAQDWAKGKRFIEYILAWDEAQTDPELKLQDGERWILEGLMAIRGSRNGVFWANPVAMIIWLPRARAFLRHQQEQAELNKEKEGGNTRRYLLAMSESGAVVVALHANAIVHLTVVMPWWSAIGHVEDLADDLPKLDQTVYEALVDAGNDVILILGSSADDDSGLFPSEYDKVSKKHLRLRKRVRGLIFSLSEADHEMLRDMLERILPKGASMFHRHTIERQAVADPLATKPNPKLGTALHLSERRKAKVRGGRPRTQRQEAMFGTGRSVHDAAPSLLQLHLGSRVLGQIERPSHWFLALKRKGLLSAAAHDGLMAFAAAVSRTRANANGGRRGEYLRVGRARKQLAEEAVAKARQNAEKAAATKERLRASRVSKLSQLEGMSNEQLLDQIRVFCVVDGVKVRLSGYASKLARIETLAELFSLHMPHAACDCDEKQLREIAGMRICLPRAICLPLPLSRCLTPAISLALISLSPSLSLSLSQPQVGVQSRSRRLNRARARGRARARRRRRSRRTGSGRSRRSSA
jgi:hypothetical protein